MTVPVAPAQGGAFAAVPSDATVIGTNTDGSPAIVLRTVGAGHVLAFAGEVMFPKTLDAPGDLPDFARTILSWRGAQLGVPAWRYELPGNPAPGRLPWPTAVAPLG
jgi:hypothetical protein